jgi:molybdopterin molybdotransferase
MRDERLFAALDAARRTILENVGVVGTEKVELAEAQGRVLRQRIVSDIDYPRADISSMDGYCLNSSDTAGASEKSPLTIPVVGTCSPGAEPPSLESGACALITTGAPLARGADAVVKYEDVTEQRDGGGGSGGVGRGGKGRRPREDADVTHITLMRGVRPGSCVRKQGEVAQQGSTVLEPGRVITPRVLGILASFADGPYEVSRRPRAGVLATGDEIVAPGGHLGRYAIRDSNSATLVGMLEQTGCEVVRAGRTADTEAGIVRDLGLYGDCDVVMISGGVSGGRFDYVPGCLKKIGAEVILRGVKMRPGKPVLAATRGDTAYFGVPGNPVSAVVSFHMLFRPAILAMMGRSDNLPVSVRAKCAGAFAKRPPYTTFAPAVLSPDLTVRPTRFLDSSDIISMADANALVCVPEGVEEIRPGGWAQVYPLDWFNGGGDQ